MTEEPRWRRVGKTDLLMRRAASVAHAYCVGFRSVLPEEQTSAHVTAKFVSHRNDLGVIIPSCSNRVYFYIQTNKSKNNTLHSVCSLQRVSANSCDHQFFFAKCTTIVKILHDLA
jgi:hypothetical protein